MLDIEKLKTERLAICKECPLYKEGPYGAVCNSSKYISKDGKEWSWIRKDGFVKGCGCSITRKVSNPNSKCIVNKW